MYWKLDRYHETAVPLHGVISDHSSHVGPRSLSRSSIPLGLQPGTSENAVKTLLTISSIARRPIARPHYDSPGFRSEQRKIHGFHGYGSEFLEHCPDRMIGGMKPILTSPPSFVILPATRGWGPGCFRYGGRGLWNHSPRPGRGHGPVSKDRSGCSGKRARKWKRQRMRL